MPSCCFGNQESARSERVSRRRLLRNIGAGGMGVALLTRGRGLAIAQEATPGASAVGTAPVTDTIAAFRDADARRLIELFQSAAFRVTAYHTNEPIYVRAPRVGGEFVATPDGFVNEDVGYVIGRPDDLTRVFSSLALVHPPKAYRDGEYLSYTFDLQGIYLGRTEHTVDTSIGPLVAHIGYVGTYAGNHRAEGGMKRAVVPLWIGWEAAGGEPATGFGWTLLDEDIRNPTERDISSMTSVPMAEGLATLDRYAGAAVVLVDVGFVERDPDALLAQVREAGFPEEFYERDVLNSQSRVGEALYNWLLRTTLEQAEADGYVLWSRPDVSTPIRDAFPELVQPGAPEPALPDFEAFLDAPALDLSALGRLPGGASVRAVIPRPESILA